MLQYPESELILNPDGSVYHLNLLPDHIGETIITVGDQERVAEVSKYFDSVIFKMAKREFVTHTGFLGQKKITVISTGIGTDNIDIVLNELDALANIDLENRKDKLDISSLNIIRIGTSGALQPNIPVDSFVVSEFAIGLDSLMQFYPSTLSIDEIQLKDSFTWELQAQQHFAARPYTSSADNDLLNVLGDDMLKGITITCPGFYAPQGRRLRAGLAYPNLIEEYQKFNWNGRSITNFEMETAGIYALSKILGHKAISFNAIMANRALHQFSKTPAETVDLLIRTVLERINDL